MLPRQLAALSALQIYVCAYCALRLLCVSCCGVLVVSLFALVGVVVLGVRIVRTPLLCAVCVYFSLCCNVFACVCVVLSCSRCLIICVYLRAHRLFVSAAFYTRLCYRCSYALIYVCCVCCYMRVLDCLLVVCLVGFVRFFMCLFTVCVFCVSVCVLRSRFNAFVGVFT